MIFRPSLADLPLVAQLPRIVRTHNSNAARESGVPEILEAYEPEIVHRWISRWLVGDPTLHIVLSQGTLKSGVDGAMVAQLKSPTVAELLTFNASGRPLEVVQMFNDVCAWARGQGATLLLGSTHRNPRAFERLLKGVVYFRDLSILEVT